jgi:pimeloyl-ACP methyl ester carboxylesterase
MVDEATIEQFYSDVPPATLERFKTFLRRHTLQELDVEGTAVPYYASGRGSRTLLGFCGGHSTPYSAWETIESFERDYCILVADISGFGTVAHLNRGIDRLLDSNGVDRVVLLGQSLAGLISQIYFKQRFDRVDGMVLTNTMALKPGGGKPLVPLILKWIPEPLLRAMFKKKFRAYFDKGLEDPQARDACRFGLAHLDDVMTNHFTKKKVVHLMSVLMEFGREGYQRSDFPGWLGKNLVMTSEDDAGFKDLEWFLENLPGASSHVFPPGLGHLPQLVHRDKIEQVIRNFLNQLR